MFKSSLIATRSTQVVASCCSLSNRECPRVPWIKEVSSNEMVQIMTWFRGQEVVTTLLSRPPVPSCDYEPMSQHISLRSP